MADANAYAVQTQQRWAAAAQAGHFDAEIAPVELKKVLYFLYSKSICDLARKSCRVQG